MSETTRYFVQAVFELDCKWSHDAPCYRIYVNDDLFTERTWQLENHLCLEQILQINAPAGKYVVRIESVGSTAAEFSTKNHRVELGPARWQKGHKIIIRPFEHAVS